MMNNSSRETMFDLPERPSAHKYVHSVKSQKIREISDQSFHKKGKRITDNRITIRSRAINSRMVVTGMGIVSLNVAFDNRINKISCGMIRGKPRIAIMAAFCCAFAAIAAKKVNTRLRLQPPSKTSPMNAPAFTNGFPRNRLNKARLSKLISSISKELNKSFANTKSLGPAME